MELLLEAIMYRQMYNTERTAFIYCIIHCHLTNQWLSVLADVSLVINNVHSNTSMLLQAHEKTKTAGKK